MIDYHTPQRHAWLKDLQRSPILADTTAALLGALAFIAALFL